MARPSSLDIPSIIDMACIDAITVEEIARLQRCSKSSIEKVLYTNRDVIKAAKAEITIESDLHVKILDLWGSGLPNYEIAIETGMSQDAVRRLILIAEYEEESQYSDAAEQSLLALFEASPNKLFEEDVRALTEYSHATRVTVPVDCVLPFSQDRPHRMAPPAPSKCKQVTLASSAAA